VRKYTEEEVAAEEKRIGARLPDDLRRRFLEGAPEVVVLRHPDGYGDRFELWGPSTTKSDTKGREYPTPGMARDTDEVRQPGDLLPDDVVVAWAANGGGDLAVVLRDGTLAWWQHEEAEVHPAEVDWDPAPETLDRIEAGEDI
jgi:hypothetical protein